MFISDRFEVNWNLEIIGFERGKRRVVHQRTHNIVVNGGRQMIVENLAASAFSGAGFTRTQNTVVRYMGLGIGGSRQNAAAAMQSPLADSYPAGYGGTNEQTDVDVRISRLERPIKSTQALWLKQVATPATFPTATSVQWTAMFDAADINLPPHTQMPISEIGLYSSSADPAQPNGGAGPYPGGSGHLLAYDTFLPLTKTGFWSLLVRWTWKI